MKIGVLALQGAVTEHVHRLKQLDVNPQEVRLPRDLEGLDGLILPGGESTTLTKLILHQQLRAPLLDFYRAGQPIMGTCAGMILLAKHIEQYGKGLLGILDIQVTRNGFGRQVDSFETYLDVQHIGGEPFKAVFIRAPYITSVEDHVEVLAKYDEKIVGVRQGRVMAVAFHPELVPDLRIHEYFIRELIE